MATGLYTWKSTDELAQKNRANTMQKAMAGTSPSPFTSGTPSPAPAPGEAGQPLSSFPAPAPSPGVSAFAVPKTMSEAMRAPMPTQESNTALAQQNIQQGFQPLPSYGPADDLARNELQKTQDANQRATLEQSALARRGATGQIGGDLVNYLTQSAIPQKADLEAKLQDNRMKEDTARAQNAQTNLANLGGLAQQKELGLADIASREKLGFAGIASTEKMQDKGIASTEKISFAQLSQAEKELAQKASQFTDQLSWDKEATKLGLDDKTAERVWQGSENQKERTARATDSNLNRELQKYLGDRGLDMDEQKLAENIRQFDSREAFDKWATQAGLDEQAKDRVWKSNEADVSRKWETGERMSTQDHQVNLARIGEEIDKSKMLLQQTLNIDTMDKQAAIDKIEAATANEYMVARDNNAMSHDQAMEKLKFNYTAQLEAAGYDHDTAMQAAEIHAASVEKAQDRALETLTAKAELAYKYKALAEQTGLSQQEIDIKKKASEDQLSLGLKQLGIDEKKVDAAIKSQEFQDRAGTIETFMEMAGDNQDAADKAAIMYLDLMKSQGLLTDQQYADGVKGIKTPEATDAKKDDGKIEIPKTGVAALDETTGALVDPFNQFSKGNYVTGVKNSVEDALTVPFKALKSLKFW